MSNESRLSRADLRTTRAGTPARWRYLLAVWAAVFAILFTWSLATPVSAGPDESGHIVKAAASVRGDWTGTATTLIGNRSFDLPANIGNVGGEKTCFAFNSAQPASCAPSLDDDPSSTMAAATGAGSYNPVYYLLVGWPSLFLSGEVAIYAMRAASALLSSFLIAVAFAGVNQLRSGRRIALTALVVGLTPMAYFLGGVLNPNGAEVAGVMAFIAVLWLAITRPELPHRTEIVLLVGGTAALVCNLRSTSPLFLLLAAIPVLSACGWSASRAFFSQKVVLWSMAVTAVVASLGVAWTLLIGLNAGFIPSSGTQRDGVVTAFVTMLKNTVGYGREMVAVFGWLDTQVPDFIYMTWTFLVGLVFIGALAIARRRMLVALVLAAVTFLLLPAILQAPTAADYGYIWQGRYSLPLFVVVIMIAGLTAAATIGDNAAPLQRRLLLLIFGIAGFAHVVSFFVALKRYVVGTDGGHLAMIIDPSWDPPVTWTVLLGLHILALAAFAAVLARTTKTTAEPTSSNAMAEVRTSLT